MIQQSTRASHHQKHLMRIFILMCSINLLYKHSLLVQAGSKSSKGTSKTTVIAIDGGSGGAKPHPVPVPWPVVHCHHHHHHMKYVPKPVMVHHWVKKFKYGPEELSATNVHDSKHLMPTMIDEHEVPVMVPDSHGPQPIEEVKMHVNGLDSTYEDLSSRKLKADASSYGEHAMHASNSNETLETGKPNHPFVGSNDQELDESRVSVNRNPAINLVADQLRRANEIEQTKARRILERLLQEQSNRLTSIQRGNQLPLYLRGRHALSQAETRSVELMSKLASQRANYEAKRLISRMAERSRINNKAREATSSNGMSSSSSTIKTIRTFPPSFSAIRNLFGFGSSGSGHNRLSRASIKKPSKQWHVAFGDPMNFSASSSYGRVLAPPPTFTVLDIERQPAATSNQTKPSTASVDSSTHYSMHDLSSYGFGESSASTPKQMSQSDLFKEVPPTSGSSRNNNKTITPNWPESDTDNNLRRPDELVPNDPLSMVPSYLEFPVTPELWSEQALKSINAATKSSRFQHHIPSETLELFPDSLASSSDWTSPSLADLNELFEFSAQNIPKGIQTSPPMRDVSSMEQFEAVPSGSMVNPQSSSFQSYDSLNSALTDGASHLTSGTRQLSQFEAPSTNSQLRPSPFDSSLPIDSSSSLADPMIESSNELNQMRQFQSMLSQPLANNLTGMVRLSGQLRNPMRTLGATQAAQLPNLPNIPSPPNIPMPGLPAPGGMLLQMAGLALPFALARVQRQGNRQTQPMNTAASVSSPTIPRQRLLTRALNSVTRRRPRRPAQSTATSSNPFSRLTSPQSSRLRNFMQTVRDMSQPSKTKPRTRIRPKMDAAKSRKTRVGRAMESLITEQRLPLPIDAIPIAVQTDGSLSRFVPVTSPMGELERELSRRQVAQQVDSFIPPQETLNRSPLYKLQAVYPQQVVQIDSARSQLDGKRRNPEVAFPKSPQSSNAYSRENSHVRSNTRASVSAAASPRISAEDLSVVEIDAQEFGQRQTSSKENQQPRVSPEETSKVNQKPTTESYSFSSIPPTPLPTQTQSTLTSTVTPNGSSTTTVKPTLMRPTNYVQALRLVQGLAHTRLNSGHSGSTGKVS